MKYKKFFLLPLTLLISSCNVQTNQYIDENKYPNDKYLLGEYGDFVTSIDGSMSSKQLKRKYQEMCEVETITKEDIYEESYQKGLKDFFDIENKIDITMHTSNYELYKINQYHFKGNEESYRVCDLDIQINNLLFHYEDVGFRLKGNTSRGIVLNNDDSINQRHYKLCFNETFDDEFREGTHSFKGENEKNYREERTFFGLEKLDIRWNKNQESTHIREYYAYEIYRDLNNLAPKTNPFHFTMNLGGENINSGIYLAVEPIDKDFLKRNLKEDFTSGDLYKLGWAQTPARLDSTDSSLFGVEKQYKYGDYFYTEKFVYDLKTNKKKSKHQDIKNFIDKIITTPTNSFDSMVKQYTNYESFINYLAISYLLGDPDDLRGNYNNTYLYFYTDGESTKAYFIPTDHDRVLGQTGGGGNPTGHHGSLNKPFDNNTGYNNINDTPLFTKSIFCNGNENIQNDYLKAINNVIEKDWFEIDTFDKYFNIAKDHYNEYTTLSERITNNDVLFSLKEDDNVNGEWNLSVDVYMENKKYTFLYNK